MSWRQYFPDLGAAVRYLHHLNGLTGFRRPDSWPTVNYETGWRLEDDRKEFVRRVFEFRDKGQEMTDERTKALFACADEMARGLEASNVST